MFGADSPRKGSAAFPIDEAVVSRIFREEYGRSVAALIRAFGDIDVAEDAVQEAFAVALRKWPGAGLPPNPGGWITTTARNVATDRHVDRSCSGRWRCSCRGTAIPARPRRSDLCRTIGFA